MFDKLDKFIKENKENYILLMFLSFLVGLVLGCVIGIRDIKVLSDNSLENQNNGNDNTSNKS